MLEAWLFIFGWIVLHLELDQTLKGELSVPSSFCPWLHFCLLCLLISVTRFGYFWQVLATSHKIKLAQIFRNFLGYFEKW